MPQGKHKQDQTHAVAEEPDDRRAREDCERRKHGVIGNGDSEIDRPGDETF